MIVTHKITMDLTKRGAMPKIDAVQGDSNTRTVEVSLFSDGAAWEVPEGASLRMRYSRPDGTGGSYDTMPDGSRAWSISGNMATVTLVPQMLTAPGCVFAQVELTLGESSIATFMIQVIVERNPAISAGEIEREGRIGLVPIPEKTDEGKFLRVVEGKVIWTAGESHEEVFGDLNELATEDKRNLVAAINELEKTAEDETTRLSGEIQDIQKHFYAYFPVEHGVFSETDLSNTSSTTGRARTTETFRITEKSCVEVNDEGFLIRVLGLAEDGTVNIYSNYTSASCVLTDTTRTYRAMVRRIDGAAIDAASLSELCVRVIGASSLINTNDKLENAEKDNSGAIGRMVRNAFERDIPSHLMAGVYQADGSVGYTASHHSMVTDYIAVTAGETYVYSGRSSSDAVGGLFFDDAFNVIDSFVGTNEGTEYTKTVPDGAAYAIFQSYQRTDTIPVLSVRFPGKRIVSFLGDSITAGVGAAALYHMNLSKRYGWKCKNYGCSGSGFAVNGSGTNYFGHGECGKAPSVEITGETNFVSRATEIDPASELIVVFGGTNDYSRDITESDFRAAVENVIDYFQTNYPSVPLLFLTPPQRNRTSADMAKPDGRDANAAGLTLLDYADLIIDVCEAKSVMYVDLYRRSGINPYNTAIQAALTHDGLHPSDAGHTFISNAVGKTCAALLGMA